MTNEADASKVGARTAIAGQTVPPAPAITGSHLEFMQFLEVFRLPSIFLDPAPAGECKMLRAKRGRRQLAHYCAESRESGLRANPDEAGHFGGGGARESGRSRTKPDEAGHCGWRLAAGGWQLAAGG